MDIYITEIDSGRKIQLPAIPDSISCGADGRFATYDIMNKGDVRVPNGRSLEVVSWEGMLPGPSRENEPWIRKYTAANELDAIFIQWRIKQPKLKLVITDTNINMDCYLQSYTPTHSGGHGDITYSITFEQRDELVIKSVTVSTTSTAKTNKSSAKSTSRTTKSNSKTYTVKSGDCLWNIAKKYYGKGAEWKKIYNANKDIIEKEAKKRGKKSSDNGHWIWPGTVLTIP